MPSAAAAATTTRAMTMAARSGPLDFFMRAFLLGLPLADAGRGGPRREGRQPRSVGER